VETVEEENVWVEGLGRVYTPMGGVFSALGCDDILRYVGILG
jgi:hypothetical protein